MLEGPYIVIFVILTLVATVVLCVLLSLDHRWAREAEWARDWERHRDQYMESRLRLDQIADEAGFMGEGLARMREHDFANEKLCEAHAAACRNRIPKWLRRRYLAA